MDSILFIFIVLVWGTTFVLMKKAAGVFGAVGVGAVRLLLGSGVLLLMWKVMGAKWSLRREHLPGLLLVALLGYAWPFVAQPYVIEKYNNSAFMGMVVALVPLLTIIVSLPMLGVRPTTRQFVGVVAGLFFFVMLMGGAWKTLSISATDLLVSLSVPVFYAIVNTYIKRRFADVPAISLTTAALGLGGLVLLPIAIWRRPMNYASDTVAAAWVSVALLGVLGTGLAYYAFYRLVQTRGPLFAGMVSYLLPFVALAWGFGDREETSYTQVVSLIGVVACVAAVQYGGRLKARHGQGRGNDE